MTDFLHKIDSLDEKISGKIRVDNQNSALFRAAALFARSGDSWFWCAVLFIFWLFVTGEREQTLAWWGGTIAVTALLVFFLKRLIARTRPEGEWGSVYRKTDPYSFPSGHSVRAGLIVVLAAHTFHDPWITAAFLLWAVLMMLGRVAAGVHYFFDIIGGFLIGLLIGWCWMAVQPWFFSTFPRLFDKSSWFRK